MPGYGTWMGRPGAAPASGGLMSRAMGGGAGMPQGGGMSGMGQGAPGQSSMWGPHPSGGVSMHPEMMASLLSRLSGIPHFAAGGVVTQPTIGMIGEAGPEAVVPLGGRFQGMAGAAPAAPQPGGSFLGRMAGAGGGGIEGQARGYLNAAGQAGMFSPFGSPQMQAMLRRRALMLQNAGQRNTSVMSQLYGLDPMQQRAALVNSGISGNEGVANALNQAEYQGMAGNQDRLWQLLMGRLDAATQERIARQQADAASRGGLGSLVGGLAGSFLGPLGSMAGSALGGAASRGGGGGRQSYGSGGWA